MAFVKQALIFGWAACAVSVAHAHASQHATKAIAVASVSGASATPTAASAAASGPASVVAALNATPLAPPAATPVAQSLGSYAHLAGPLRIVGESASRSVSVPVSARESVRGAILHLVASNSVSLLSERSQLVVRVNDRAIAQFPLSPRQPELTADIRVPPDALHAGYNNLSFSVAQHSTENCEEPNSPELWTEVDTDGSTFQIQTDLKPLTQAPPVLADLDDLIDPKQSAPRALTIVSAAHPANDLQLANGGLLAQGIALRLRYLNAVLHVRDAQAGTGSGMLPGLSLTPLAGSDVLLVGTRDTLRTYLDERTLGRIGGAFLGVYPKPDDPRHFVLVVSGLTDDDVNLAARAFSHAQIPLPRRNELTAQGLAEARPGPDHGRDALSGTAPYRFRELGFKSVTLGVGASADLKVTLPADLYAPENAQVSLTLNFAEGAKMRADSVLNLFLNDRFEQAVALDQQEGAVVDHYRVNLPLRHFRPGANVLTLRPVLVPLVTERCALRQSGNLQLSVFDDSSLKLPPVSHFTTLPDLQRFAESGFPYSVRPDGEDLALRVMARDNDTLAAAWSLLGKLAQKQGRPLVSAQVTGGVPAIGRNTIVVGANAEIPQAALIGAPWEPGKTMRIASGEPVADGASPGGFQQWLSGLKGMSAYAAEGSPDLVLNGDVPLSRQLLVMQYRGAGSTTTTLLTAASPAELVQGIDRLIEPQYWEALGGDVSIVSFDNRDPWTARVGRRYEVGSVSAMDRIGYEMSTHPWLGYGALSVCLAVLAALTSLLLRRYHRKHHDASQC